MTMPKTSADWQIKYPQWVILFMCLHVHRTQAKAIAKSTGCKGSYSLMNLPGHDRVRQTVPDAMHTVKDCVEKLVFLVIGNEKATHYFDRFSYINCREM